MPLITLMAASGTPIIILIFIVAAARIIVIINIRRLWLRLFQLLLRTIYHILDNCHVDTNLEFPVSWVFARRRFDEVRNVECLSGSMVQTCEFVIAGVKDDNGAIDSDDLCPCLPEI
jgi:hypothetical protein